MRIAVDVGGTFTDVIVLDEASQTLRLEKVETTPHDPATGVLQGFHKANTTLGAINYFVHGTTLGLNALLTRRGAKVAIVANVARELGVPQAIVPPGPANFSALGMLMVDVVHDFAQTHVVELHSADGAILKALATDLIEKGQAALARDGFESHNRTFACSADLRYQGQEHTVNVPIVTSEFTAEAVVRLTEDFNAAHMTQYGHCMDDPVEIVTLRVSAVGVLPRPQLPTIAQGTGRAHAAHKGTRTVYQAVRDGYDKYGVYERGRLLAGDRVDGPAIIEEPSSTTVVQAGDVLTVGKYGELVIHIGEG